MIDERLAIDRLIVDLTEYPYNDRTVELLMQKVANECTGIVRGQHAGHPRLEAKQLIDLILMTLRREFRLTK